MANPYLISKHQKHQKHRNNLIYPSKLYLFIHPICAYPFSLILSVLCLLAMSCDVSTLRPKQYQQWIESNKNGLLLQQITPSFRYTLLYKPKPYLVLKTQPESGRDQLSFDTADKNLADLNYASLWLETSSGVDLLQQGRPTPTEIQRRTYYCSFAIQQDLSLIEGQDTLKCVFAHWERLGSIASRQHFILAFEQSRDGYAGDKTFVFKNNLQKEETARFFLPKNTLDGIPTLQF